MNTTITPEEIAANLAKAGGKRWTKGQMDRVYFTVTRDDAETAGLRTEHYNTGWVSSARWDGEPLANGRAVEIEDAIREVKVYVDLTNVAGGVQIKRPYSEPRERGIFDAILAVTVARATEALAELDS